MEMNGSWLRPPDLFNKVQLLYCNKKLVTPIAGRMVIDAHYISFCPDQNYEVMQMPVCTLETLDRRIDAGDGNNGPPGTAAETNRHFIDIGFKTCVRWKLLMVGDAPAFEFMTAMNYRMAPRPDSLYDSTIAFHWTTPFKVESNGWEVYDFLAESKRMFSLVDKKYHWKLTLLNMDYGICGSYPPRHYVPPYYDDLALKQVAAFRDGNRFPAFSWIHPLTTASLVRCSQPLPGRLGGKRCPEDEQLIAQIFKCNPDSPEFGGYVLDARPYSSAMANRAMGAGFERSEHYGGLRVEFLGIENIHAVSDSLIKLKRAVRTALPGPFGPQGILGTGVNGMDLNTWLDRLNDSGWLKHVQTVLNGAVLAATLMHVKKTSVIVHCTHGWDRTAQLTSLPMLMLDTYYRTYVGFQVLIEKEWVSYGHKFLDRCNHTASTQYAKEQSPIFLQFLDCVHQLLLQFPTQFEFNEKFLIDLLDVVYSCQYGTFLTNNHQQHGKLETHRKTISAWSYFNHSTIKPTYLNPLYDATEARKDPIFYLRPSTAGNKLQFWDALFNRSDNDPNIDSILQTKYMELKVTSDSQIAEIEKLRAEIAALKGEAPVAEVSIVSPSPSPSVPQASSSLTISPPPTTGGDSTDAALGVVERSITSPTPSSSPSPLDPIPSTSTDSVLL